MDVRVRSATGAIMVISGLPAFAQTNAQLPASAASTAPPPPVSQGIVSPGDPTWFVAGLLTGLVVGYVAAKALSGKRNEKDQ